MDAAEDLFSDPFTAALSAAGERYRRLNARIEKLEAQRDEAYEELQRLQKASAEFIESGFKNPGDLRPDFKLLDLVAGRIKRKPNPQEGEVELAESKKIELALTAAGIVDWKVTRVVREDAVDCITLTRAHRLTRHGINRFGRKEIRLWLSYSLGNYLTAWDRGKSSQNCVDAAIKSWPVENTTAERKVESQWDENHFKYVAFFNGVESKVLQEFENEIGSPPMSNKPAVGTGLGLWNLQSQARPGHDPPRLH